MGSTTRLADHIARTLTGPMWHGPALLEVLNGVSAAEAARRPVAGTHSIWELVLHTAVWAEIAHGRLHGAALDTPRAADDFPLPATPTEEHWIAAIARLDKSYRVLSRAVSELTAQNLSQTVQTTGAPQSIENMLHGTIEHGAYHAGQMALLKRAGTHPVGATERSNSWRAIVASAVNWNQAHATFDAAISNLPPALRGQRPDGLPHSIWEIVDHMRRTQHDLLEFCRNTDYHEPNWPDDYWPSTAVPASNAAWDGCIAEYRRDNAALSALTVDTARDLMATIPHGTGLTYLRTILVAIDHNSHHVGQIILVRRLLGSWPARDQATTESIDSSA